MAAGVHHVWTSVAGLRVHARVAGERRERDIVVVHGLGLSGGYLVPLLDQLEPYGRVWAPDLPGYGRSGKPPRPLGIAGLAAALAAWMRTVGLRRPLLIGNSVGCQVIVHLAARVADQAYALVLTSPTVDIGARTPLRQFRRWLWAAVREPWRLFPVALVGYLRAGLRSTWRAFSSALADRPERLVADVDVPVVVVRGTRDPIVPPGWAALLARRARWGELVEVPGGVHALPFDAPAAVAAVARALLDCQDGGR